MANNPISFFIYTSIYWKYNAKDISIDNVKTNEKLVIKKMKEDGERKWLISRYPLNAAKKWIETNEKEIYEWKWNNGKLNRKINMDHELTIAM
jgi:hypothetical protein